MTELQRVGSGRGVGPLNSLSGPYDATPLHTFIRDTFPGAVLLEEHQVSQYM